MMLDVLDRTRVDAGCRIDANSLRLSPLISLALHWPIDKPQSTLGMIRRDIVQHLGLTLHGTGHGNPGPDFTRAAPQGVRVKHK